VATLLKTSPAEMAWTALSRTLKIDQVVARRVWRGGLERQVNGTAGAVRYAFAQMVAAPALLGDIGRASGKEQMALANRVLKAAGEQLRGLQEGLDAAQELPHNWQAALHGKPAAE
jgi:hypothetical protein